MVKTLNERVGTTCTVKKVWDVMTEKYAKTSGGKILDTMRKISSFKTQNKVDVSIYRFKEKVTDTEKLKLAENLRYSLSLQFVERLETGSKINTREKMIRYQRRTKRWGHIIFNEERVEEDESCEELQRAV